MKGNELSWVLSVSPYWFAMILSSFSCVHKVLYPSTPVFTFLEFCSERCHIHWSKICRISCFVKTPTIFWSDLPEFHLISSTLQRLLSNLLMDFFLLYCVNRWSLISLLYTTTQISSMFSLYRKFFYHKYHSLRYEYFGKPSDKKVSNSSNKSLSFGSMALT